MREPAPKPSENARVRILLLVTLMAGGAALGVQRAWFHCTDQQRHNAILCRRTKAVKDIERSERANFRSTFYPHKSVIHGEERASEYGEGEDTSTFLAYEKPLQIGTNIQLWIDDLHGCPEGQGKCSYSGMIKISVNDAAPIIVDVFGIGTIDANWFSVRNGTAVMPIVAAVMERHSSNSNSLASPTHEDFLRAIEQCWKHRHCNDPEARDKLSLREQALRGLGICILRAICCEWHRQQLLHDDETSRHEIPWRTATFAVENLSNQVTEAAHSRPPNETSSRASADTDG